MKLCNGKIRYRSEKEAKNRRNIREKDVSALRVYKCPECFDWHLTKEIWHDRRKIERHLQEDEG